MSDYNKKEKTWRQIIDCLPPQKIDAMRERFITKQKINPDNGCWEWTGCKSKEGFGLFWLEGRNALAHRIAWFLQYGKMPKEDIIHSCGNPVCVNPKHLFLLDPKEKYIFFREKGKQGIVPSQSKLTDEDIANIKDLYENSELTLKEIGILWGVSGQYISKLGKRKNKGL
jgi:hypothetical protein